MPGILPPKVCLTASALLLYQGKVLLIKHKKVRCWLAPGGHIDPDELPHQAAERECWEETGIKVVAIPLTHPRLRKVAGTQPLPFQANLHWVCEANYLARSGQQPVDETDRAQWKKGCEQHYNLGYFVKPTGQSVKFAQNIEETDGIGWFGEGDLADLETLPSIRRELQAAFAIAKEHTYV